MKRIKPYLPVLLLVASVLFMAAGVNGVFNNVTASGSINSVTGYKFNGAAGSSGQALCSDGTYFDTPCAVGVSAVGTPGTYAYPSSVTTNSLGQVTAITAGSGFTSGSTSAGYWNKDPSGLIRQFGTINYTAGGGVTSPFGNFTFPTPFATTNYALTGNANTLVVGGGLGSSGDIPIVAFDSFSTTGARWRLDSNGGVNFGTISFQWTAIGY